MAKTSGSVAKRKGGLIEGDSSYKGKIGKAESLVNIQNAQLYKSVKQSISRYHSVLGVKQQDVKLAEMSKNVGGVHLTVDGRSKQVLLNSKVFKNGTVRSVSSWTEGGYKSGHLTKTNKPVAHIITHELAHATWNSNFKAPNVRAAGKEVTKLYEKWSSDTKKTGYGRYAKTSVNEFWAEVSTKAVHGKPDKYTRKIKAIIKKYKL